MSLTWNSSPTKKRPHSRNRAGAPRRGPQVQIRLSAAPILELDARYLREVLTVGCHDDPAGRYCASGDAAILGADTLNLSGERRVNGSRFLGVRVKPKLTDGLQRFREELVGVSGG